MTRAGHMERCAHCGSLVEHRPPTIETEALAMLAVELEGAPEDCWRFFRAVWSAPGYRTTGDLARDLAVDNGTMMTRFMRAGLPSPNQYRRLAIFTRAARMFELPGFTLVRVAAEVGVGTHQSLSRMCRHVLGITTSEFRRRYTGADMLERYRQELILPYRNTLREFSPIVGEGIRTPARTLRLARSA